MGTEFYNLVSKLPQLETIEKLETHTLQVTSLGTDR